MKEKTLAAALVIAGLTCLAHSLAGVNSVFATGITETTELAEVSAVTEVTNIEGTEEESSISSDKIFEMRIYTTYEGKLENLHERFRNHTIGLFEKHGMTNVGYWVPRNPETSDNTLIYVLSHESREAAEESWAAFRADPVWQEAYEASHTDGEIVSNVESIFMDAIDYSPLQ